MSKAKSKRIKKSSKDYSKTKSSKDEEIRRNDAPGEGPVKDEDKSAGTASTATTSSDSSPRNDAAWYAKNEHLLESSARISFGMPTGGVFHQRNSMPIGSDWYDGSKGVEADYDWNSEVAAPGILSLVTMPTFGDTFDDTAPVNVAIKNLFSKLRRGLSGRLNYTAADFALYIMNNAQLYSFIVWLQRLYAMTQTYTQENMYIQAGDWIKMNYVDPDDLLAHLNDFRGLINTTINKLASYKVPFEITYLNRSVFLYRDIYSDGTNIKDQQYMFVPYGFLRYHLYDTNDISGGVYGTGGGFKALILSEYLTSVGRSYLTYYDICQLVSIMLSEAFNNDAVSTISGDIGKVFGDNIVKLSYVEESTYISPIFAGEVLCQIKNAQIYPYAYHGRSINGANIDIVDVGHDCKFDIVQFNERFYTFIWMRTDSTANGITVDENHLITTISEEWTAINDQLIDIPVDTPTPGDVMEATRFVAAAKPTDMIISGGHVYRHFVSGSEVVLDIRIATRYRYVDGVGQKIKYDRYDATKTSWNVLEARSLSQITNISTFNNTFSPLNWWSGAYGYLNALRSFIFAPRMHLLHWYATASNKVELRSLEISWDFTNTAKIDYDALFAIQTTAWLSMLDVPDVDIGRSSGSSSSQSGVTK